MTLLNPLLNQLRTRFRRLATSERGMALPVALFAMASSMALAGAAVVATVDAQSGTHRDNSAKAAIAAADAGANVARSRQTHYGFLLSNQNPCLQVGGASGKLEEAAAEVVGGAEWCPEVSGTVGDSRYVYRVSPVGLDCGGYELCVVSTGTADTVSRRIEVTYERSGGTKNTTETEIWESREKLKIVELEKIEAEKLDDLVKAKDKEDQANQLKEEQARREAAEGFVGRDEITMSGNADVRVSIGTNGNLVTSGNTNICGNVRHGVGKAWKTSGNAHQCSGYQVASQNVTLPSVASFMPPNIATVNSNYRLVTCTQTGVPAGCQSDTLTSNGQIGGWSKNSPFNPTTREIKLSGNNTLTVGGGDYWLCAMSFSGNSQLIMAKGSKVRFFFDKPENCGYNGNQLDLSGNNRIAATGYQPSLGQFDMPGFYFLGSTKVASQINLSGNFGVTNEMVVYGPDTAINLSGNANWKGVMVGKTIAMSGNGRFEQDAGFELPVEVLPIIEEGITDGGDGATAEEPKLWENDEEREQWREDELTIWWERERERTNITPVYFTPKSYFECAGTTPVTASPNANC